VKRAHDDGSRFDRTMRLVPSEQAVTNAVHFAELAVSGCSNTCREAIALAACELAENVAKYGVAHADPRAGTLSVGVRDNVVRLTVTNAVRTADEARSVTTIVSRISASASVAELYRARLAELFANPAAPRAQLGLLRLAFEGGFKLSATYQAPLLQIVAERPCVSA
jgi:hypothetical protein